MYAVLVGIALLLFAVGGLSWFLCTFVYPKYKKYAVMVAASLAAVGGFVLILNAVIHPDSIIIPDVEVVIPEINVPTR